ncbi:hypothetical protein, partial [Staphylococcus aureus]|uniref:hypothetical protein n=1 Tax=Staphylococcus aureus TaxID=1280 RepID=UPI001F321664
LTRAFDPTRGMPASTASWTAVAPDLDVHWRKDDRVEALGDHRLELVLLHQRVIAVRQRIGLGSNHAG